MKNEDYKDTILKALISFGFKGTKVLIGKDTLGEPMFDVFLNSSGLTYEDIENEDPDFSFDKQGECVFGCNEVILNSTQLKQLSVISKFFEDLEKDND